MTSRPLPTITQDITTQPDPRLSTPSLYYLSTVLYWYFIVEQFVEQYSVMVYGQDADVPRELSVWLQRCK